MYAIDTMTGSRPQSRSVEAIFESAREHVYYSEKLKSVSSFADCPTMDKAELYQKISEAMKVPGFMNGLYWSPSGGTTGNKSLPGFFPTDIRENEYQRTIASRYLIEYGVLSNDTIALNLMPNTHMYRACEIFNEFCQLAQATCLPVSAPASLDDAARIAIHFKANTLIGMPTRLMEFAEFVANNKIPLQIDHIIYSGEHMSQPKHDYLQAVLKCSRFSAVFGSAETGIWAFKPHDLSGERYIVMRDAIHVEVVEADADGYGTMVLTNLVRTRNPVLRYKSGDIGRLGQIVYRGRRLFSMELKGRESTMFHVGGQQFAVSDSLAGVSNFQLRISREQETGHEKVEVLFVAPEQVDAEDRQAITDIVKRALSSSSGRFSTDVQFVSMDAMVRSRTSNKIVRIVDERQPKE